MKATNFHYVLKKTEELVHLIYNVYMHCGATEGKYFSVVIDTHICQRQAYLGQSYLCL